MTDGDPGSDRPPPAEASQRLAAAWRAAEAAPARPVAIPVPAARGSRWRQRRRWAALAFLLAAAAAMAVAWKRGSVTRIIFINAGDEPLASFAAAAAGQTATVPALDPEASFRWLLESSGQTSAVSLHGRRADGSPWFWEGARLTPGDGRRLTLRVLPDGSVEADETLSIWRAWPGD